MLVIVGLVTLILLLVIVMLVRSYAGALSDDGELLRWTDGDVTLYYTILSYCDIIHYVTT